MRKARTRLAPAGAGQVVPGRTLELAGRMNWAISEAPASSSPSQPRVTAEGPWRLADGSLVDPRLGREDLYLVGQRIEMHRAIVDAHLVRAVEPDDGVLHPL